MTSITQDMKYRLSLIRYAEKYGVTKAAIKYKTNRQYIYRWKRRLRRLYESPFVIVPDVLILILISTLPEEIQLIRNMRRRNPHTGLVTFLGKTQTAWLYQIHYRIIPLS